MERDAEFDVIVVLQPSKSRNHMCPIESYSIVGEQEGRKESTSASIQDSCTDGSHLCVCACIFQNFRHHLRSSLASCKCCRRQRLVSGRASRTTTAVSEPTPIKGEAPRLHRSFQLVHIAIRSDHTYSE
jgi:hypothetical protein